MTSTVDAFRRHLRLGGVHDVEAALVRLDSALAHPMQRYRDPPKWSINVACRTFRTGARHMKADDAIAVEEFVRRHPDIELKRGPGLRGWPNDALGVEGVWVISRSHAFTPRLFTGSTIALALQEAEAWLRLLKSGHESL